MCHPGFPPVPLQLPQLPAFLPHPWPPHLLPKQQLLTQHLGNLLPAPALALAIHVSTTWTNGLSTSPKPPSPRNSYPSFKKVPILPSPPNTPIEAYITAIEHASSKLPTQEADELRSDVNRILKQLQQHTKHCNLNPSQCRALTELKKDNARVVLTVDKGVAMVIMEQQDYTNKAQALLQDTNTYKVLPKDPTSQLENKLITLFKNIKQTGGLTTQKYKQLYPASAVPPKFYGLPKIHRTGTPLRPIVSSRGPSLMVLPRSFPTSLNPL